MEEFVCFDKKKLLLYVWEKKPYVVLENSNWNKNLCSEIK